MKDEIQISTKHIPLRVALFILALLVAVGSIAYGVSSIGRQKPGYSVVDPDDDKEALLYHSGVVLNYYFDGSSGDIREQKNLLRSVYSRALSSAYKQLDASACYEGINNLATLNQNPGQTFELSPELYGVLQDALEKTRQQRGYSVFAGALYAEWNSILTLSEPEEFDPLYNGEEARRIREIAEATAELSSFSLELLDDERHLARFSIAGPYRALLEELELDAPALDLNLLREAYELQMVARELEAAGYRRGYLSTDSGLTLSLSEHGSGQYVLYGSIEDKAVTAAKIPVTPGSASSLFRSFALMEGEVCFYRIDGHARHPYVPADGEYRGLLDASLVCSGEGALVEACYRNILLQTCGDEEQLERTAQEGGMTAAWTLRGDTNRLVHTSGSGEVEAASEYGFSTAAAS